MTDGVFRYSLDGVTTRSLSEGLYGFVVQVRACHVMVM